MKLPNFRNRPVFLAFLSVLMALILVGRLYYLQIIYYSGCTFVLILIAAMALTIYHQSTGGLFSPEAILNTGITVAQRALSGVTQYVSGYLYRVKLRSNIEYEYNQLKAQNDELILKSLLYDEVVEENVQLRALLGEYEARAEMNPVLARVIASETGNYFSTFTINKGRKDGVDNQMAVIAGLSKAAAKGDAKAAKVLFDLLGNDTDDAKPGNDILTSINDVLTRRRDEHD